MTESEASAELLPIRRTAVYHFARIWIERMQARQARAATVDVESACIMLTACFPGVEISIDAMAVALADSGYMLKLRRNGRLVTNLPESAMFKAMRGLRQGDSPHVEDPPGHWRCEFPAPDHDWPTRLRRIDADIAAAARKH